MYVGLLTPDTLHKKLSRTGPGLYELPRMRLLRTSVNRGHGQGGAGGYTERWPIDGREGATMTTGPREEAPAEQAPYARRMSRESSVSYMDCLFSVLAASEQTEGRFGLMEMVAPKGREPSRHLHYTVDEGFYVLEGELTFYVGEKTLAAGPGTFVFLPHGVPHSYTFHTDSVRMLSIVAPGGLE